MEPVLSPDEHEQQQHFKRRAVLQAAIGVGAGLTVLSSLYIGAGLIPKKEVTPESEPIAPGDWLVYGLGSQKSQLVKANDLGLGQLQTIAYPMNPQSQVVKSGEADNTVMLIRLEPASLSAATAQYAAEGIVAYSAVCKHLGCIVSNWDKDKQILVCPCHQGRYDPKQQAKVVGGPPPAPVPQLPIRIEQGRIVVAGEFLGAVGPG